MQKGKRFFFSRSSKLEARSYSRGASLIDVVVGSALMLVVFMGISAVFQLAVEVVSNNKARAGAVALAGERMEYIRSLSYDLVGTAGGIPAGAIAQSETVSLNGISYTRRIFIAYVDDPRDNTGPGGVDNFPTASPIALDYKIARVDVSWASKQGERHIVLVTRIEPPNGMEIACPPLTPCGTLSITVVDAATEPVGNAQVRITNSGTSPAIDVTTYTNVDGMAVFVGAPQASDYNVTVTKTGYNSDQTYAIANPVQGPQTVSANQTTSPIFRIDVLAGTTVYTFTHILPGTWTDPLSGTSNIASSTNASVGGGVMRLAGSPGSYPSYGEFQSIAIAPGFLAKWKTFSWTGATSTNAGVLFRIYDISGTNLVPDGIIPGNSAGLTSLSVDLSNVSTSTYTGLSIDGVFSSNDSSETPSVDSYSVLYDYGPVPLPYIAFTLQGEKIIGSPPPVYKYSANFSTDGTAMIPIPNIEWDTYRITVPSSTGYDISSSCSPQPQYLAPGSYVSTRLLLAAHTAHSLLVEVKGGSALLPGASVRLEAPGFDVTETADSCGQAFFSGLSATTYSITVSAPGYQPYTNADISVSGTTTLPPIVLNL